MSTTVDKNVFPFFKKLEKNNNRDWFNENKPEFKAIETNIKAFYNTLLESDDPAIVVECLNGYRLKEKLPTNLSEIRTPIGIPEITQEGTNITIVTYGSTWRIVSAAAKELQKIGISCEVIDVQSLLPFDVNHKIVESITKTNKVLFVDEDVSSGATAFS